MRMVFALAALCAAGVGAVIAQPTNTTLPGGWSWQPLPGGSYDTGLVGTKRGGNNGQMVGPFTDTSFGIMDEQNTPWFDDSDLSAQQYVQRQLFGNFGTGSPPGPAGTRFFNFGYNGTSFGSNFANNAAERRGVSLNHWNNPNPDAGGVATLGQIVFVPVAATLEVGQGWGGDEMLLKVIGGNSGQQSQFFVDATLNASFTTTAFGGLSQGGNQIRVNAVTRVNDAGPGQYDVSWGYGGGTGGFINQFRSGGIDAVFINGQFVGDPGAGLTNNSVGASYNNTYNVLSSLVQTGGSFNVQFDADALLNNLTRDFGNADVRAQIGPGMEGNARLVVRWEAFQAIPTPGVTALLGLGAMAMLRRRR
jgi:hypothetical protein